MQSKRQQLEIIARAQAELLSRHERKLQARRGWYDANGTRQGGLMAFVRYYWSVLEPETPLVDGWALWAICEHLEAVSFGEITRLLINVPPGFMKSLLVDVFWPAWEWGPLGKSHLRYVTFSYSATLTERDNNRFSDLITNDRYLKLWSANITPAKTGQQRVTNVQKGWKLASSVGGVSTGERGDRVILDDPNNVKDAESSIVRNETIRWFRESMSNRLNNLETGVIVIIMQRVHEDDVSGAILGLGLEYCHLMIPMEYDATRAIDDQGNLVTTQIGWIDPRCVPTAPETNDGELAWPERFPEEVVERTKTEVGPYAYAGQYQQSPAPRGGGIILKEWWGVYEHPDGKYPPFELVIASVDSAFTSNQQNDPTAMTVWGVWYRDGKRRLMLMDAWRKHLAFSGPRVPYMVNESKAAYARRTQGTWGLLEWIQHTCDRWNVDRLLIEGKASGLSAAQELQNRYGRQNWSTQLVPVKGDKVARCLAVQAVFSQGGIFAPIRDWSDMVINEMAVFPAGKYDDLTDSSTQAVKWLRDNGMAPTDEEVLFAQVEEATLKPKLKALYPV